MNLITHIPKQISAALLLCFLNLPACGLFPTTQQKPASEENTNAAKLVGRIASISADGSFVIIQSYGPWDVPTNTTLASSGSDGRTANLRVSGEKQRQFAAADVRSGTVEIGDAVFTTLELMSSDSIPPNPQIP